MNDIFETLWFTLAEVLSKRLGTYFNGCFCISVYTVYTIAAIKPNDSLIVG